MSQHMERGFRTHHRLILFLPHSSSAKKKKKPSKTPSGLWEKLICISIFATMAGMLGGLRRDAQYLKSYCESLCRKHHILHLPRITDACFQTFLHIGCEVLLWGVRCHTTPIPHPFERQGATFDMQYSLDAPWYLQKIKLEPQWPD